jgi:superkiller protein 3
LGKALLNKGQAFYERGSFHEAVNLFEQAVEFVPDDGAAYVCLAKTLYILEKYGEAYTVCKKAIRLDPTYTQVYAEQSKVLVDKGEFLFELRRYREALAAFKRALQFDPDNATIHICQGDTLFQLERYEEAGHAYRRAIQLDDI